MADRGVSESRRGVEAGKSAAAGFNQKLPPDTQFDFPAILGIADAIPMMIAFIDRGQRYRFVNRALADWFERPRCEILGRTAREVLGEPTYAIREPLIEAALGGERQWFAAEYSHPTRGSLAVQSEYIPQLGPDGEVRGLVMLVEDITEQRGAGRALKESEERFRRIADSAPVMMWVTRIDSTRDFVNDAYAEFVGLSREESRSYDWRQAIHPDDQDRIVAESIAGEATLEPFALEGRYRRHDGQWRWLRSVSSPRFEGDKELVGFIGAATDITLAKEAELELKLQVEKRTRELSASEARFRSIFDTVMEIIVLLKPDGTVIEVNRTPASWRAAEPRLAIGKLLWEAPTLARYPGHEAALREGVEKAARGEIFVREVAMERSGEPTAYLDVSLQPVRGADGEISFLLFEARDITELKGAQEQLRQSQKMEALGQLTGGIAHDFNNLLTVVVGGLDLITKKVEDGKLKRYADNALAAAERGARLTAQLLAFSRVQKLEVRPTQVAPLIENMRPLLRNVLGPGITKHFDLDSDMMAVMVDPTQFELAVLNLAINARDAMPDGGTLYFHTRKVRVAGDAEMDDGDYIELAIRDTGSGMPPEIAARAFEPFFTTKEVGKGTGLGLSMVYGVARQSGGTARIESTPGKGTSVKLYFRRAEGEGEVGDSGEAAGGTEQRESGTASVLVIDDDPDVRGFIAASLDEFGHRVHQAADGETGLELFREERPDLVVLDFVMPGLSGADVARQILAVKPGQPILFVSGYSETEAIHRVAPSAPLLVKPFRADALNAAVRDALAAE